MKKPPAIFADALVPFLSNVRNAQGRVDQRIALLRHIEALRLYAALHDDTLPAKLADVAVPLPVDPFTGKPFRYELVGNTAHLRGTPPVGNGKGSRVQHPLRGNLAEIERTRCSVLSSLSFLDAGSIA